MSRKIGGGDLKPYPDKLYMDLAEFVEKGYLQEVNRLFFHPLGLALMHEQMSDGSRRLGGVWDVRNDKEGIVYDNAYIASGEAAEKAEFIRKETGARGKTREKKLGFVVQPVGEDF